MKSCCRLHPRNLAVERDAVDAQQVVAAAFGPQPTFAAAKAGVASNAAELRRFATEINSYAAFSTNRGFQTHETAR